MIYIKLMLQLKENLQNIKSLKQQQSAKAEVSTKPSNIKPLGN